MGEASGDVRATRRGWGPFSGAQLTVIICTLIVMILFPVGAWAVAGSNVFVTDASNGRRVGVDAKGGIVGTIHDAGTGKTAAVNSSGQLAVSATGSVIAAPAAVASSYNTTWQYVFSSNTCDALTQAVPPGKALVVLSITVSINATSAPGTVYVSTEPAKEGAPCVPLDYPVDIRILPGQGVTDTISFPQGLPINSGHVVGMHVSSSTGATVVATAEVKGYLVPASQCTAKAPPTGCW